MTLDFRDVTEFSLFSQVASKQGRKSGVSLQAAGHEMRIPLYWPIKCKNSLL